MKKFGLGFLLGLTLSMPVFSARDNISIVGSSTVFPFSKVVAERFGRATKFKTPTVESTGTGGGFKEFCSAKDINAPDIVNASRRIKLSEYALCKSNGVKNIIEVLIGFDGIVFAHSAKNTEVELTRKQIYLALAEKVPNPDGSQTLIANPYKKWSDISPELPNKAIEVMGPPVTSGTRDAFVDLVMEGGCRRFPWIKFLKATDNNKYIQACRLFRTDGAFIEAVENDNLIVHKLVANPNAFGIFGFSFLDQNTDLVQASVIDEIEPDFETIAIGTYPVSRPLYFYVNKDHMGVVPGIKEYLLEFANERAWGDEGYLAEKGLVPLSPRKRGIILERIMQAQTINL